MDTLARLNHRGSRRQSLLPQSVAESSGSVDDNLCGSLKLLVRFDIAHQNPVHEVLAVFGEASDLGIVEQRCSLLVCGQHHVDKQASVVKLTVKINRASAQAFSL